MKEEEILQEQQKLMESLDPSIIALLAKKRKEKFQQFKTAVSNDNDISHVDRSEPFNTIAPSLHSSNAAVPLVERGAAEQWIHFNVVETDKLEWMRDIPNQKMQLKPGEKFEARFDWKGILIPYISDNNKAENKDERELYLHGDEPQRPGYTLQELFRLARSNVIQQRISAFGAISGMLNIYQQGFYDRIVELPITKIFFLLRFGFDDKNPAILEVVAKALAFLFYNETDEILLDFCYENPGCHWQPTLRVLKADSDHEDAYSVENLQKQFAQLQMSNATNQTFMRAEVEEESEEENTTKKQAPLFYDYPQHLYLKLIRIMISSKLLIAKKLCDTKLIDILQNYLSCHDDLKTKMIKVQIECLRILKCLLLLRIDYDICNKKFLSAFRYMLEWHYNHLIYEEGGPYLLRQHAAAILMCITSTSGPSSRETLPLLADILNDCCCKWFHAATRSGVKEFSQITLLNTCLNVVVWYNRHFDLTRFSNFINKYLKVFIESECFEKFTENIMHSSIILHDSTDRRTVHQSLPNVGSIIMHAYGPQLIVSQKYPIYFLSTLWRIMEMYLENNNKIISECLLKPVIVEPLVKYLHLIGLRCNRYLATNFFSKMELRFIYQLLRFSGIETYFQISEMLQIVYNFLNCLTAEYILEIEQLFEKIIFNPRYLNTNKEFLDRSCNKYLEMIYSLHIVVRPNELTLASPFSQIPVLPIDWPYFPLRLILQNFLENVQHKPSIISSEREVLQIVLRFVTQLEKCNQELNIVTSTEKLMYLMIAFMGPDSSFLDPDIHKMLHQHLLKFYTESKNIKFDFDAVYPGKCQFQNLYALFVDHFQAASYGDELFSSLVMVPLAMKYDNKWRRRLWSDYASALRFLNCGETLLIGGLTAYLEPAEEEESLLKAYNQALNTNLLRLNSLPYEIAKHHIEQFQQRFTKDFI
uniref:RNA polymerase II-associated protein 1 C-terminal domain-containing protein n=1 Tax=Glossina brevipalpis TaxID=37001 RepID=A0A1A9WBV2_9MUSC